MNIDKVMGILRRETQNYAMPVIGEISLRDDPFRVLISCILSLRTKDDVTASASKRLFVKAPDAKYLARLPVPTIEKLIFPVGFYRTKAVRIRDIARTLISDYDSKVPDSIDELLKLKGVGRKTANIVITVGFKKPGIAVDTHVHRISNRMGYVKTRSPDETESALRKKLPKKYWQTYNELLVTWGQNICKPISPLCSMCSIKEFCGRVGVNSSR